MLKACFQKDKREKDPGEQSEPGFSIVKHPRQDSRGPWVEQRSLSLHIIKPFNLINNKLAAFSIASTVTLLKQFFNLLLPISPEFELGSYIALLLSYTLILSMLRTFKYGLCMKWIFLRIFHNLG